MRFRCCAISPTARKACSGIPAASTRTPPATSWKSTALPEPAVYDFTADVIKAGRVGDRALAEVKKCRKELARRMERLENDPLDARESRLVTTRPFIRPSKMDCVT